MRAGRLEGRDLSYERRTGGKEPIVSVDRNQVGLDLARNEEYEKIPNPLILDGRHSVRCA